MYRIGIDIGSTAAKVSVFDQEELHSNFSLPTGWSSLETATSIKNQLASSGIQVAQARVVATGYGRISVPYADRTVTEITCHGIGTAYLLGNCGTIIDIGGQDTKIISLQEGQVTDFMMNDKCAAGTGKFLELMANTLGVSILDLCQLALRGEDLNINSMCTVFAESEVISLIGQGRPREDIARGVLNSIIGRVSSMLHRHGKTEPLYLTGGLCELDPLVELLAEKLQAPVTTSPLARYAGSIGAALLA